MAIVHSSATIRPTKPELLEAVLGGPVEVLGSYRFDDPAGEVGVEAFGATVRIVRNLGDATTGPALVANWTGGEAVVAGLGD